MELDPFALASALEASPLGVLMRGSRGLYPAANVAHVIGLVLLVGAIGVVDLRVMGFGRAVPLAPLSRFLTPIAMVGFAVLLASGVLLFAADAGPLTRSAMFQVKMGLSVLALANALAFRRWFGDGRRGSEAPPAARIMAAGSLAAWLAVACLGRLIAYS